MTDWNSHFRRIAGSHKMSREEVVECLRLGGMEISRSRADGWRRGLQGGTLERGARRSTIMSEAEFDAFTSGLIPWARAAYRDENREPATPEES